MAKAPTKAELLARVAELEAAQRAASAKKNRATDLDGFLSIVVDELVPAIVAAFGANLSGKARDEALAKVANVAQRVYNSDKDLRPGAQDGRKAGSNVREAANKVRESAYELQEVGPRAKRK